MKNSLISVALGTAALVCLSFTPDETLPEGWIEAGHPNQFEVGIDTHIFYDGGKSVFIQSKKNRKKGFGNIMQTCSAQEYLGKMVKMTGYIKAENVEGWAGLWFRVDASDRKRSLSFDNMHNRPIKGTSDWKKCEIILEVPDNSYTLNFGALLNGTGKIWFDNISFETVTKDTKSTAPNFRKPTNTNFEE